MNINYEIQICKKQYVKNYRILKMEMGQNNPE